MTRIFVSRWRSLSTTTTTIMYSTQWKGLWWCGLERRIETTSLLGEALLYTRRSKWCSITKMRRREAKWWWCVGGEWMAIYRVRHKVLHSVLIMSFFHTPALVSIWPGRAYYLIEPGLLCYSHSHRSRYIVSPVSPSLFLSPYNNILISFPFCFSVIGRQIRPTIGQAS